MPKLILLVGPSGSGKSTVANKLILEAKGVPTYINQDLQGKDHLKRFEIAIDHGSDIIVDRMNFSVGQRRRYLDPAKAAGYTTEIIILHESYDTCLERCVSRKGHPTIQDEVTAVKVLNFFFTKYERVQDSEADQVTRLWPMGAKEPCIIVDIDGTLANIDHRLHHMKPEEGKKKNWKRFFDDIDKDTPNEWCVDIVDGMYEKAVSVFCSGRPDEHQDITREFIADKCKLFIGELFMRRRNDFRTDYIIKEVILDFEILTRYKPLFAIDDRQQVVDLWRRRGIVALQCSAGDF